MDVSAREGHWVILQNVHLVKRWLPKLEKRMEQLAEGHPHQDYRLYISAEPNADPHASIIPQVLEIRRARPRTSLLGSRVTRRLDYLVLLQFIEYLSNARIFIDQFFFFFTRCVSARRLYLELSVSSSEKNNNSLQSNSRDHTSKVARTHKCTLHMSSIYISRCACYFLDYIVGLLI